MSGVQRILRVEFETPEQFESEYHANLINGGVFIATDEPFEDWERVQIGLDLVFCRKSLTLEAEVVHRVGSEMSGVGATPGVAVQFRESASAVRDRLEPLLLEAGCSAVSPGADDRRGARRTAARVVARIDDSQEALDGHTRDLSQSGVLVSVPGRGVEVGQRVQLTLTHPGTGESMEVEGQVVRAVESRGDVAAVAVRFEPPEERRAEVERFVEAIQTSEHTRRLGGINGAIEELGPHSLLQMFGTSARAGTLTLRRGEDEGIIGFEGGLLRVARLGALTGMRALVQLLSWTEGRFEFQARLEPVDTNEPPLPLEAALLEATRQIDESGREGCTVFPEEAHPIVCESGEWDDLGKTEEAVLDLARAGSTVGRMLDVIPEAAGEIHRALEVLRDLGRIRFDADD